MNETTLVIGATGQFAGLVIPALATRGAHGRALLCDPKSRELTGRGVLYLHASSDETDVDVVVKLSLLPEGDGKPPFMKITQGWLRASHRAELPELTTEMRPFPRHDREEPIVPGMVYELRIELLPMSVLLRTGERLRLEIINWESAQTEAPMTHWYGRKVGTDIHHHDILHPSRLRLHERPRVTQSETLEQRPS